MPDKTAQVFRGSKRRMLQIFGPPGSGKSMAVFRWTSDACNNCQTQAYWISCAAESEQCWFLEQGVGGNVELRSCTPPQTAEDVGGAPIVVFDGIRKSTIERWRGLMNEMARAGIAVFIVSSEGVRLHEGDSGDILKLQHFVPSWTQEEYVAACRDDGFWAEYRRAFNGSTDNDDDLRRRQLLETKFVVAGHSARFMFQGVQGLLEIVIRMVCG